MKIAAYDLNMAAAHRADKQRDVVESLRAWRSNPRPETTASASVVRDPVVLSDDGLAAQATDAANEAAIDGDPRLSLLRQMLEALTGERIRVFDVSELEARFSQSRSITSSAAMQASGGGGGFEYRYAERYSETEQTRFSASGKVITADGQEISFNIELSMERSYVEERSFNLQVGEAARKVDPLVLNFAGNAAQLADSRFAFDLDADGRSEQINLLRPGSGYLVFDRNGNGRVDNGKELFGPTLGDGFTELAALDSDDNGWIDENDPAFAQLSIWQGGDSTDRLHSLTDAGVGALALQRLATPFDLKTQENQLLGSIRSSGIFLQESGSAGTMQQIDLTA